jgi:CBS domain containing-hemolysin-like protein
MANPVSPTLNRRTTLKDALSMMLDADVQTGIVVDRTGAVQGLLTVDAVAEKMREGEHAPEFDQLTHAESEHGEAEEPVESADDPAADPAKLEVSA